MPPGQVTAENLADIFLALGDGGGPFQMCYAVKCALLTLGKALANFSVSHYYIALAVNSLIKFV